MLVMSVRMNFRVPHQVKIKMATWVRHRLINYVEIDLARFRSKEHNDIFNPGSVLILILSSGYYTDYNFQCFDRELNSVSASSISEDPLSERPEPLG